LACQRDARTAQSPQHLILITLDTLRSDRLGVYGHENAITPHLDGLAERGVRFADALAPSISTPPSHASILTGLNPGSHGLRALYGEQLAPGNQTLADLLRGEGFTTAAFVSGLPLRKDVGLSQGFDHYDDSFVPDHERSAEATNRLAIDWLAARPAGRLFLWVHYFDPHYPYFPPAQYRRRFGVRISSKKQLLRTKNGNPETGEAVQMPPRRVRMMSSLYDAEVSYLDAAIGELLRALEGEGILEDAVIVAVSDHGELLGEHEYYFGHWDVFDETARVPMLLVHPGGNWAGRVVGQSVGTIDIMPTVLAWLGIESGAAFDGRDLTPWIAAEDKPADGKPIYTEQTAYFPVRSVRDESWLLIERGEDGERRLYRRGGGPGRLRAVAPGARPEVEARLARWLEQLATPSTARRALPIAVPDDVAEGLRALGYTSENE
jgi:arylsulfatase A-like enzyme